MTCPRCARDLEVVERDDACFGHCPECGGIWFDFEDLDRMVEAAVGEGVGRASPSGRQARQADSTLRCPRCQGGLVPVAQDAYPYLACVVCYGRWVDGGDLPQDGGLSRRLKVLFRKFVEGKKT